MDAEPSSRQTLTNWVLLATTLGMPIAVDRLVFHPTLASALGADMFGGFLWVQAVLAPVATLVGGGLSNVLIRSYAPLRERQVPAAIRDAARTSVVSSGLVTGGILLAVFVVDPSIAAATPLALAVSLGAVCVFKCSETVLQVPLRADLLFGRLAAARGLEALALLATAALLAAAAGQGPAAIATSAIAITAGGVFLSGAAPVAFLSAQVRRLAPQVSRADDGAEAAPRIHSREWMTFGASSGLEQLTRAVPRLVLGIAIGGEAVGEFYAGWSLFGLFLFPATVSSVLLLSQLARAADASPSTGVLMPRIGIAIALATAMSACAYAGGLLLVQARYPQFAEAVQGLAPAMSFAVFGTALTTLLRPVVVKWGSRGQNLFVAVAGTVGTAGACAVLVPLFGPAGAAIALALGSATALIATFACIFRITEVPPR